MLAKFGLCSIRYYNNAVHSLNGRSVEHIHTSNENINSAILSINLVEITSYHFDLL